MPQAGATYGTAVGGCQDITHSMRSYRIRVASASDACVVLTLGMALLVYVLCLCWRFRTQPQDKAILEWKQYSIDKTYFGQLGLLMMLLLI